MKWLRDASIKQKLRVITLLTSGVALLVACGAFGAYDLVSFRESVVQPVPSHVRIVLVEATPAK